MLGGGQKESNESGTGEASGSRHRFAPETGLEALRLCLGTATVRVLLTPSIPPQGRCAPPVGEFSQGEQSCLHQVLELERQGVRGQLFLPEAPESSLPELAGLLLGQLCQGFSLEGARLQAVHEVEQLTTLCELTSLITSQLDPEAVKASAIRSAARLMGCEAASLLLLDDRSGELYFDQVVGEREHEVQQIRLGADEGIAGWVVQHGQGLIVNQVAADARHSGRVDQEVGFQTREIMAAPLRAGQRVLGCLQALNTLDQRGFCEADLPAFQALADQVAVAVENSRLYRELECTKELVERQQEALIQAEKLSAMGQLSAGVAQEIRSPISAISGYAQLIRRRRPEEKILKPVQVIEEAASRINRVVNGLLDFASKDEPDYQQVQVEEILVKTIGMARETLERYRNIEVVRDFHGNLPTVTADSRQLQQVFLNLLLNAIEATSQGGRIVIKTFGEPYAGDEESDRIGRVVVLFQDQGEGISPDDQSRVFQPFFTTSREGGTGLGLSICRSIVQQHRGAITFESQAGEGTTFRVHLPVERDQAP